MPQVTKMQELMIKAVEMLERWAFHRHQLMQMMSDKIAVDIGSNVKIRLQINMSQSPALAIP